MAKKETAEQKLLRMIEDSGGSPTASDGQVAMAQNPAQEIAAAVKGTGVSVPPVFSILSDKLQSLSTMFLGKSFGLKQLNMTLVVFIVVALLALGFFYKSENQNMEHAIDFSKNIKASDAVDTVGVLPQYKPLASFLEVVLTRNIFRPYEKKVEGLEDVAPGMQLIAAKVKSFKLVGISWLDTPDSASVMVENAEGVTLFLKENDTVSGVLIKKIFADRVIFAYQDQEMEVRL